MSVESHATHLALWLDAITRKDIGLRVARILTSSHLIVGWEFNL